jgi:excisionase family DNA binding protein
MAAYATSRLVPAGRPLEALQRQVELRQARKGLVDAGHEGSLVDALLNELAARVAEKLAASVSQLRGAQPFRDDEWFDSRHAAEYLGVHRDTLRKLAAERAMPSEQDGPNCKLYFRRTDLDAWRRTGGRPRHLAPTLSSVA